MPQSADHVLQNPFVFPSNTVSGRTCQNPETEMMARPNEEDDDRESVVLPRNGNATGGVGLRERRVSRQESRGVNPPPPQLLNLNIPQIPHIPVPFFGQMMTTPAHAPSPEETDIEGVQLFENFIHEEVRREELLEPENFTPVTAGIPGATGGINANTGQEDAFLRHGRHLREIADDFSRSAERRRVMDQANSVDLVQIRQQDFLRLLGELFDDGASSITVERIVVLFYFCRDLAVRAIRENINSCFISLMKWSINFIRQRVCLWVQQHGGWDAVLQHILTKKLLLKAGIVLLAVGATVTIVGLLFHWQKNA